MVRLKRRPNGYGTVKTLSGRRSCPYLPCVSFNGEQKPLNAFSDPDDAFTALEIAKLRYDDKLSAKEAEKRYGDIYKQISNKLELYIFQSNPINTVKPKTTISISKSIPTFKEIYDILDEEEFSKLKSRGQKRSWFNNFDSIHELPICDIEFDDMQFVLDELKERGRKSGTLAHMKVICKQIFEYAVIRKYVKPNEDFSSYLKIKTDNETDSKHHPFTIEEIRKLFKHNTRESKIVLIYIFTGTRPIELFKLTRENIYIDVKCNDDGNEKIISYINTGSKTEAGRNRNIPIHDLIKPFILELINENNMYLFMNDSNNQYIEFRKNIFNNLMEQLNFAHTPYDTRHTFNTLAKVYNMDDFSRKRIVGHKSKDITDDVYTHTILNKLFDEMKKINIEK